MRSGAELVVRGGRLEGGRRGLALVNGCAANGSPGPSPDLLVGDEEQRAPAVAAGVTDFVAQARVRRTRDARADARGPKGIGGELGSCTVLRAARPGLGQRTGTLVLVATVAAASSLLGGRGHLAQTGTTARAGRADQVTLGPMRASSCGRNRGAPPARFRVTRGALRPTPSVPARLTGAGRDLTRDDLRAGGRGGGCARRRDPERDLAVVRLFDGHRTLPTSSRTGPFRVVETVRVARNLYELEAIRRIGRRGVKGGKALVIEEWLVRRHAPGGRDDPDAAIAAEDEGGRQHDKQELGPIPQPAPWSSAPSRDRAVAVSVGRSRSDDRRRRGEHRSPRT